MPEISVTIPEAAQRELNGKVAKWEKHCSDMSVPFKRFGLYMTRVTDKTFKDSGRPPGSWQPLSEMTLSMRRAKGSNSVKPLIDEGDLFKSFTPSVGKTRFVFGTSDARASRHQFGGIVMQGATAHNVPARPMINWLPKDEVELEKIVENYMKEIK